MLTRKGMLIFALVCLLALTGGGLAQAGDPTPAPRASSREPSGSGGPLNTSGFPISLVSNASGHNHETHSSVAFNSVQKNYLVVWQKPDPFGNQNLWIQIVKRDGSLFSMQNMLVGADGWFSNPDVAYDGNLDQYLVVWEDSYSGVSAIHGIRLDNLGNTVGSAIEISAGRMPTDTFHTPAIAYSYDFGQYLVTWRHNQGSFQGIEARTVDLYGIMNSVWELTGMILGDPELPDVADTSVLDQFLVVWQKTATPNTDHDIYGRRFKVNTIPPSPEGPVFPIHFTAHDETAPSVAGIDKLTGIGQYLVVTQSDYGGSIFIDGQLVTDGGALDGGPFYISSLSGTAPSIAGNQATQEYLVAWIHNPEVHARTISTAGIGGQITQLSGNFPGNPAVSNGPNGDFLIAAEDYYLTGYPFDIFGYLWGTRLSLPAIMKN